MADEKVYAEPSEVTVEGDVVSVKGPDSVDVKLTPEAADETSARLLYGAMQALGQKIPEIAPKEQRAEEPDSAD